MDEVKIDQKLIPPFTMKRFVKETVAEIRRIQAEQPELWAKVQARAKAFEKGE